MDGTHHPVVVGVDGSPASRDALHWAAAEAAVRGLPLRIMHAVGPADPERWTAARAMIAEAVARARAWQSGIAVSGEVIDGQPVTELCAASETATMVVMANRGAGGFAELLLGSVSSEVAMFARSAVTVVHGSHTVPDRPNTGRSDLPVLVGADSSAESEKAIGVAFEEASARGVTLVAIRAWHAPPNSHPRPKAHPPAGKKPRMDRPAMEIAAQYAVNEALARWQSKYPGVRTETRIVREGPASALVKASAEAQLIVVGSRGHTSLAGLRLGATADQLLHHVHCPIMIVRCCTEAADA